MPRKADTATEEKPKTARKTATKTTKAAPKKEIPVETVETPKQTKVFDKNFIYANGKRKTSVARVRLYPNGTGSVTVNERSLEDYLAVATRVSIAKSPLRLTGHLKTFDISVKVEGGGVNSQAEAIRHGISKALLTFDPSLRITLKRGGFLTRDPRMKERKKYGLHRARRAPQFSKR